MKEHEIDERSHLTEFEQVNKFLSQEWKFIFEYNIWPSMCLSLKMVNGLPTYVDLLLVGIAKLKEELKVLYDHQIMKDLRKEYLSDELYKIRAEFPNDKVESEVKSRVEVLLFHACDIFNSNDMEDLSHKGFSIWAKNKLDKLLQEKKNDR